MKLPWCKNRETRSNSSKLAMLLTALLPFAAVRSSARSDIDSSRRPITVADGIEMTRLGDNLYFSGNPSHGRVARFSPDGKRFVIVLRTGNLKENTNEFSMLLFETGKLVPPTTSNVLVKMASSSNRDAITEVRWLDDNATIVFLGENPGEEAQIYTINADTHQLARLTNHPTSVIDYDISRDRKVVLYAANPPRPKALDSDETRRNGIVVREQGLTELLSGACRTRQVWDSLELFLVRSGKEPVQIRLEDRLETVFHLLSLSPDGRYAVIGVFVGNPPPVWAHYKDAHIRQLVLEKRSAGRITYLMRELLLDTQDLSVRPLVNAPADGFGPVLWSQDGNAVYRRSVWLPLDVKDPVELRAREQRRYDVEVRLPTGEVRKISKPDWPKQNASSPPVEVTLVEDMNTPPRIYVSRPGEAPETQLIDLNPQFSQLQFGEVQEVRWKGSNGKTAKGALFLPPDFVAGRRYPLVLQTHGYYPERFSMDGLEDWSTGFAARPLAALGFVVLQVSMYGDGNANEGQQEMQRYEGAIDELDRRGLIDRKRVGIVGFSRTTYHVAYALTHSKYKFAAAVLTDGMDAGYLWHLTHEGTEQDDDFVMGGPPFGRGLTLWLRKSPEFNLDRINTPLRLQAQGAAGGVLSFWSWHVLLGEMGKPADFIYLPDAPHEIVKPWERRAAQEGLVDWFSFWLKGEEEADPGKAAQYRRWEHLRDEKGQQGSETMIETKRNSRRHTEKEKGQDAK
jgi:dipeptidyl aminopeptidase/acylaminoacyl peptidase